MKILVVAGNAHSLLLFRRELLELLVARGHRVAVATPVLRQAVGSRLADMGLDVFDTVLSARGMNPIEDLRYVRRLRAICGEFVPEVVFSYTVKPIIYSGIAAATRRVPRRAGMVTGLGDSFAGETSAARLRSGLVKKLLRISCSLYDAMIFQNPDDRMFFEDHGLIRGVPEVELVAGSGVNLESFTITPLPARTRFVMIARLMRAKGVLEYFAACALLRDRGIDADFTLVGPAASRRDWIDGKEVGALAERSGVRWLGRVDDVRPVLADHSIFVLPSYYGEGQPRTMLEAMAMGRAVIGADAPGCREPVVSGITGLLVPPRDAIALADAMARLAIAPDLVRAMGREARRRAVEVYDVRAVARQIADRITCCRNDGYDQRKGELDCSSAAKTLAK